MKRDVQPEILDDLERSDPQAIRSRRDLRWINWFLGGESWIVRSASGEAGAGSCVFELGAGEGTLTRKLLESGHQVCAFDLQACPEALLKADRLTWIEGDLLETLPREISYRQQAGQRVILVANLILHHFSADMLQEIGRVAGVADVLLLAEPHRTKWALVCGYAIWPFIGEVTRHDMPVSTRAGFKRAELSDLLSLDETKWEIREAPSIFGGWRFSGKKRAVS